MIHVRDWTKIRHFRKEEWVKDPERVAWDVVMLMDEMRDAAGVPIRIHVAWDNDGHEPESSHYTNHTLYATGVDFHFEGWSLLDQWLFTERFPWNGIGLYPYWSQPGLHVDLRRLGRDHPNLGKRWWRDASGKYHPINRELLRVILAMPVLPSRV